MQSSSLHESVAPSVLRLNQLLPLKARQDRLPPVLQALHRAVIASLVTHGRPPERSEVAATVGADQVDAALARLGDDDLIVLAADCSEILGAYPVTSEVTPHQIHVNGHRIYGMCALDALAVSPIFDQPVEIRSQCRATGEAVYISQAGECILEAQPPEVRVGVRWQRPFGGSAAHSLCMEMVFLRDDDAAAAWHGGDLAQHSIYTLEQAVAFGTLYFTPLL